jgi:septum formation protein
MMGDQVGDLDGRPPGASSGWEGLVLASGSPRRRELLARLGVPFIVVVPDLEESVRPGEPPLDVVRRLAAAKAAAVAGPLVLAADTVVEVDGELLGKPAGDEDARGMLRRLSGRTHQVHTGVAARAGERVEVATATTAVRFVALTPEAIDWYVGTGEPRDKAGAYAIQGSGGLFVEWIQGNASNVVGLPLPTAVELLHRLTGWSPTDPG